MIVYILLAVIGTIAGLGIGWQLRGGGVAALTAERDEWRDKFTRAIADLNIALARAEQVSAMRAELDMAKAELSGLRESESGLRARLAATEAARERDTQAHEDRLKELREAREQLATQFSDLASRALEGAQRNFLERAEQRFQQAGTDNEQRLKQLLAPVETTLKRYELGVAAVEKERQEAYGNLTGLIEAMRQGQEAVRSEAAKLSNSLRSAPKARGRWGEQQLRNVLETCGLAEHTDFNTEVSIDTEDGRMRPDAIIRVPGGRALVIDAKVSLNAYQDAFHAVDEKERALGLGAHAAAMKAHVNGLGNKAYWNQFADAPDYVIMFVPGEHFLSAALEHDPTLWDFAFEKRVLLATPTNLIAIARTVAAVWRQEKLAAEARRIGELGKEMYDRLAVAQGHLKTVGAGLTTAVNNYNRFVGSFERNVLSTGRKFKELNIEAGNKAIEVMEPVEALPRETMGSRDEDAVSAVLTAQE